MVPEEVLTCPFVGLLRGPQLGTNDIQNVSNVYNYCWLKKKKKIIFSPLQVGMDGDHIPSIAQVTTCWWLKMKPLLQVNVATLPKVVPFDRSNCPFWKLSIEPQSITRA